MEVGELSIKLPDPVLAQIQLPQFFKLFEVVDLDYVVIGGIQDLQVLQWRVLQTVKIVQIIVGDVQNLQAWQAEQAFGVSIVIRLAEKGLQTVGLNL